MLRSLIIAAAALAVLSGQAAAQDAAAGEKVFAKCRTCHQIGPNAKALVGPPLTGVVGRQAGGVPAYAYSAALKNKAAEIGPWDEAKLVAYLADPAAFLGGAGKMPFKLASEAERKNVVAYLATQK